MGFVLAGRTATVHGGEDGSDVNKDQTLKLQQLKLRGKRRGGHVVVFFAEEH